MTQDEVINRFIELSERECSFRAKGSVLSYHYVGKRIREGELRKGILVISDTGFSTVLADTSDHLHAGGRIVPKWRTVTVNMTDYGTTFTSDFAQTRNALINELDLKSIPYRKADNVPLYIGADSVPKLKYSLFPYIVKRAPNNQEELAFTEPTDIVIFDPEDLITHIDWVSSNYGRNMPFPHITEDTNTYGHIVLADIIDLDTGEVIGHLSTSTGKFSVAALSDIKCAFPDASKKSLTYCAIIRGFTGTVRVKHGKVNMKLVNIGNMDGELVIIGNGNVNFKTKITSSIVV